MLTITNQGRLELDGKIIGWFCPRTSKDMEHGIDMVNRYNYYDERKKIRRKAINEPENKGKAGRKPE